MNYSTKRGDSLLKFYLAIWRIHRDGFVLTLKSPAMQPSAWFLCVFCILQPQAFTFIHCVMTDEQYTEADREEVAKAVVENFQVLKH